MRRCRAEHRSAEELELAPQCGEVPLSAAMRSSIAEEEGCTKRPAAEELLRERSCAEGCR